jgi:NTE family protein
MPKALPLKKCRAYDYAAGCFGMDSILDPRISPVSLRRIELFRDLSEEELQRLAPYLSLVRAPKGSSLCKQGESADALYIIETGQVKVVSGEGSQRRVIATLGPGEPFGDLSLLAGGPMPATFQVAIDAELWVLSKSDFDSALRQHPQIAINLCRIMARRLGDLDEQHSYGTRTMPIRMVAVVGTLEEVALLAHSITEQSGNNVLLMDLIDTGDENSTIDPSDPFHDIISLAEGVDRLAVPIELSSGDFSEAVSHLLLRYDHLLVRLPTDGADTHYLREALDLCEVIITFGSRPDHWVRTDAPPGTLWVLGTQNEPGYTKDKLERERARTARRLTGKLIGLALSSGAAHGLAHIGVLRVLEQEKVPIDLLSGTSMGSVIGSAFVAGHDADDLYRLGKEFTGMASLRSGWRFWDFTFSRSGIIRGRKAQQWLEGWTGGKHFEDLDIPFFIVAAEVVGGRSVVFNKGPIAAAARASFSMPGLFEPVPHGKDFVVDGGSVDPVPCRPLADAGANIIIACNVIPQVADRLYRPIRRRVRPGHPPSIMEVYQSQREVMEAAIALLKMNPYDVLIAPRVGMYSATDANRIDTFVKRGEEAAQAALPQIRELLKPRVRSEQPASVAASRQSEGAAQR